MKEFLRQTLTSQGQTPYAMGGANFMPEGKPDMPPTNSKPTNPENSEGVSNAKERVFSENEIRKGLGLPDLPVEVRGPLEDIAREQGVSPDKSSGPESKQEVKAGLTDEASELIKKIDAGGVPTQKTRNFARILRENGISNANIENKTPIELIEMLRAKASGTSSSSGENVGQTTETGEKANPPTQDATTGGEGGNGGKKPPAPPSSTPPEDKGPGDGEKPEGTSSPEDRDIEENLIKDQYADRTLRDFVARYNEGVRGRLGRIREQFLVPQMQRLQNLISDPASTINEREAQRLFSYLENKLEEAQNEERVKEQVARNPEDQRVREQVEKFNRFLREPTILEELKKDNPDLNSGSLKGFREFMEDIVVSSRNEFYPIARIIAGLKTSAHVGDPEETGNIEVSEQSRRLLYEKMVEKLIGRADKGSEEAPYKIGSFEMLNLLDELNATAFNEFGEDSKLPHEEKTFFNYLSELQHVREIAHELNRNLHYGEQYKSYVTEHLRSAGLDFMHNELAGVNTVVRLYEKVSSNKVSQRKKWLSQGDINDINEEVAGLVRDNRKEIKKEDRVLSDWETERALRIGRIFFAGTQRMAMYSAIGDLPSDAVTPERIASLPYEFIARSLVPLKMIAPRFFSSAPGSRRYMERVFKEIEAKGNIFRFFGLDKRTIMMNLNGAFDPESHGWRSQMMFFGNISLRSGEEKTSMLEYLNRTAENEGETKEDPVLGGGDVKDKMNFSKKVREKVMGQRLYLSVLTRYGNFDENLKADLWRKISILKPSTIASLVPDSVKESDRNIWEGLRKKMYVAEDNRIVRDAKRYEQGLDDQYLKDEGKNFDDTLNVFKKEMWLEEDYGKVLKYMGIDSLELHNDEKRVLRDIIKTGINNAEELARAKMSFNFAIDDVPVVSWKKSGDGMTGLADEDLLRILLSDQKSFSEAYSELNNLIENPAQKQAMEHFPKAVEGIGNVIGREPAQDIIDPYITAWIEMASTDRVVEMTPGLHTVKSFTNQATSEMQRFFRSSFLSLDAKERYDALTQLAQMGAISDDVAIGGMLSKLEKLRKKTRSNRAAVMLRTMRIILYLLGPVATYELFKSILPEEAAKGLQLK